MCEISHFMKWLKLKIIHVLLILNILRADIVFADSLIFVDDFYKKKNPRILHNRSFVGITWLQTRQI